MVTNLLSNAYKYGRDNGHITVSLHSSGGGNASAADTVMLQVADDGIGIAEEHLPRIFDRFYQVDSARTADDSSEAGAGLGLAMVREIVQMHGGQITVESQPEEGTVFTVTLPAQL